MSTNSTVQSAYSICMAVLQNRAILCVHHRNLSTTVSSSSHTTIEIIEDLQPIIRKFENDPHLVLDDAHEEPGSKAGDNYIAFVIRTVVSGKRGDGSPYRRSLMTKVLPRKTAIFGFLNMGALFMNEAHAYNKVLPALGNFGPKCLLANGVRIMMEDLREKGYSVLDRRAFMDFEHVSCVLKALAKMHARSLGIKFTNPEHFKSLTEPLKEVIYPATCDDGFGTFLENGLTMTLKSLNETNPKTEDLKKVCKHMERYRNKYFPYVQALMNQPPKDYFVLCHGDTWTNNLMFKHEEGNNDGEQKIMDLKLVDYQVMRYQSPAVDFHYHVYTSAHNDVINRHYDELISIYHGSFIDELKRQSIPESKWRSFDLDWFKAELKKYAFFGVVSGFCLAHAHLANEDRIKDLTEMSAEQFKDIESWDMPVLPGYIERTECLSLHFIRNFD